MRISEEQLKNIRRHYGSCSSWAIWAKAEKSALDGLSDLSVLNFEANPENRAMIHADFIIVGLNVSGPMNESPDAPSFANFHSTSRWAKDYKMRDAFDGTPLWGSYMTDILKNFPEVDSSKVQRYIRENPSSLDEHFGWFEHELDLLNARSATLVALGGLTSSILKRRYSDTNSIITIKHYSSYISSVSYRDHVLDTLAAHQRI
jgi:hypothetical protein